MVAKKTKAAKQAVKRSKKEKLPELVVLSKSDLDVLSTSDEFVRDLIDGRGLDSMRVALVEKNCVKNFDGEITLKWFLDHEQETLERLGYRVLTAKQYAWRHKETRSFNKILDKRDAELRKLKDKVHKLTEQLAAAKAKAANKPQRVKAPAKVPPAKGKQLSLPISDVPGQE